MISAFVILTIARLAAPLLTLKKLAWGLSLSVLLDMVDWELLPLASDESYHFYQLWDKTLDTYMSGVFLVYLTQAWHHLFAQQVAWILFFVRFWGVLLFELTASRFFLFVFPDLFLTFFLLVQGGQWLLKKSVLFDFSHRWSRMLSWLLSLKLLQEFFIHVLKKLPWQWDGGQFFGANGGAATYANIAAWSGLFIVLHLGIMYWSVKSKEDKLHIKGTFC